MKMWDKTKNFCKVSLERLSPWMHVGHFLLILSVTTLIKYGAAKLDWIAPPLAAWELAALVHVFLVAQKLMQFRGFEFATKKFNSRVQRWVINVIILFIFLKLITICFETQTHDAKTLVPVLRLQEKAEKFNHGVHLIAPYIVMMPLFFFFAINCVAWRHVVKQARTLGISDTNQERYLVGLMKFVDAPVALPFIVMFVYLRFADRMFDRQTEDLVIGIIGCCLLVVSNLLTGVFDEHWSDVTKNRSEHSSGLN